MAVAVKSIKDAPRISSSDLARRPGQLMNEVLRRNVVIVQNRGRDVAALVDIEEYQRLLALIDKSETEVSHVDKPLATKP